jgi:acyl carrier protein
LELPAGSLKGEEQLGDLENWNSLAIVSFIALADQQTGAKIQVRQLGSCELVSDLLRLAQVEG